MDKKSFIRKCCIWTAIITAIIFLITGLCHGPAAGYTLIEELGLYVIMWFFVTIVLEMFVLPLSLFVYKHTIEKKIEK